MSEWISVKKELPKTNGYYQCFTKNKATGIDGVERHYLYNCYFKDGKFYIGDFAIEQVDVTYWQLLPEPPKE